MFFGKKGYLCGMKTVVEIFGFSSGKRIAEGMFDGLKEGGRLFGRLLGVGVGGIRVDGYTLVVVNGRRSGQRNRKYNVFIK